MTNCVQNDTGETMIPAQAQPPSRAARRKFDAHQSLILRQQTDPHPFFAPHLATAAIDLPGFHRVQLASLRFEPCAYPITRWPPPGNSSCKRSGFSPTNSRPKTPRSRAADPANSVVLIVESKARGEVVRYHQQKLVLVYSGMRHFARDLRAAGWRVDYHRLEDTPDFLTGLQRHVEQFHPEEILPRRAQRLRHDGRPAEVRAAAGRAHPRAADHAVSPFARGFCRVGGRAFAPRHGGSLSPDAPPDRLADGAVRSARAPPSPSAASGTSTRSTA